MISRAAAELATNCTTCARRFDDVARDGHSYFLYKNEEIVSVLCEKCKANHMIANYKESKEISTRLMMDASSACFHLEHDCENIQPVFADIYRTHADVYREIKESVDEINHQAELAEIALWFGRPDLATDETVAESNKNSQNLDGKYKIDNGPDSIQTYYNNSEARGHSYCHDDFKVLLWGSAGRVLMTVQDSRPTGHQDGKYNGAIITMIYDEDAPNPRGGIQSVVGTKAELLGLIQAIRTNVPKFVPDNEVTVAL